MNTLEFLQRVLPSSGFYVATVINPDGTRQGFFSTIDDLATAVISSNNRGNNTYFGISSFIEKGSRKQDNVKLTRVVALDVDCGTNKPYPDWKAGLKALATFVDSLQLPKPLIVHSGNGLHVYWVLEEELEPDQWKPLAEAMKAATADKKFLVDAGLTANSALVLRPVGTNNPKNGAEVRVLLDVQPTCVQALTDRLGKYMVAHSMSQSRSAFGSKLSQALAVPSDFPVAIGSVVATKCQQIKWAVDNQSEVPEPVWYNLIGVAAYCQEPEATAISWSERHPQFDAGETLRKVEQWKRAATGPTTCTKFEADHPGGCKGCKFKGKVGTPARLGVQYREVAPPDEAPDREAAQIPIPRPFKRAASGIKMTIEDTDIDICPFDLYPVGYGKDESLGYETVRYHWDRRHVGWQELQFRQAFLSDLRIRDFATEIADQGIVLNNDKQTGNFQYMLRSYMDELRQQRAMTNLYSTMGWKENYTQFVFGDTVYRRNVDGSVSEESISIASGSARLSDDLYSKAGSLEESVEFMNLTEKANLHLHMFVLLVGMSAPLYAFTGLKGLTISLYGPTGGGKTLAQLWQQSIWGNPSQLHFSAKFTQNALFNRLGLYCHMPVTIDEITMMQDKEVGDFLYWVSQGRDKARLNRNSEERNPKSFAMPVTVSTNRSMSAKMIASGYDTDAQAARLLELTIEPNSLFVNGSNAGRRIYNFIHDNHGYIGREIIKNLLELGETGIRAAIAEATATFNREYKADFSGQERYWEHSIVLANLIGKLATDWGLVKFDYRLAINAVLEQLGAIRKSTVESRMDTFDLLADYLNDSAYSAITVLHTGTSKPMVDLNRMPRGDIRIRFDMYRKSPADLFNSGTLLVDRTHFRKWLSQKGSDYKAFINTIDAENINATPKSKKAYLGKDSPIKLGQCYVLGINLNHPRLQGILDDADQAVEDLSLGKLKLV